MTATHARAIEGDHLPDNDASRLLREARARMEAGDHQRADSFATLSIAESLIRLTDLLLERR